MTAPNCVCTWHDITRIQKHHFCFLVVELMKPPSEQKKRKNLIVLEELLTIYFCLCFNMERKTDIRKERQTVVFIIIDEMVRASGDYPHSGPLMWSGSISVAGEWSVSALIRWIENSSLTNLNQRAGSLFEYGWDGSPLIGQSPPFMGRKLPLIGCPDHPWLSGVPAKSAAILQRQPRNCCSIPRFS